MEYLIFLDLGVETARASTFGARKIWPPQHPRNFGTTWFKSLFYALLFLVPLRKTFKFH